MTPELLQGLQALGTVSAQSILIAIIYMLSTGKLRLPREVKTLEEQLEKDRAEFDKRLAESKAREEKYEELAWKATVAAEKAANAVEKKAAA